MYYIRCSSTAYLLRVHGGCADGVEHHHVGAGVRVGQVPAVALPQGVDHAGLVQVPQRPQVLHAVQVGGVRLGQGGAGSQGQGHRITGSGLQGYRVRVTGLQGQGQGHRVTGSESQGHSHRVTGSGSQGQGHRVRVTGSGSGSQGHRVRVTGSQGHRVRVTGSGSGSAIAVITVQLTQ